MLCCVLLSWLTVLVRLVEIASGAEAEVEQLGAQREDLVLLSSKSLAVTLPVTTVRLRTASK